MTALVVLPESQWEDVEAWVVGTHALPADAPPAVLALADNEPQGYVVVLYEDGTVQGYAPDEFADHFLWV